MTTDLSRPLSGNPFRTRADFAKAVRILTAPSIERLSPGGARLNLSAQSVRYSESASEMEGMARLLWGLAPLAAGGDEVPELDRLIAGIAHGCDPRHPEYWGEVVDGDQRLVEMAAIGLTLALLKNKVWDHYCARDRQAIAAWLGQINHREPNQNNWQFFRVMVNLGLRMVDAPHDPQADARSFEKIDKWYVGNGWYYDGRPGQRDHYIAFAMHYYGLIYATLASDADPARAARFKQRAAEFAPAYAALFASNGAGLPFGRSLAYRFALGGFFGATAFAGVDALPLGETKGLILRHMRWWADRPIADRDGVLNIGFAYPNMLMSEQYNSPGSPAWALKAALPLALPADHAFWQAPEEAPDTAPSTVEIPEAGMIVQRRPDHVVALVTSQENLTHRGGTEKYAKFAYSTHFGFSVESMPYLDAHVGDSMLSLSDDGLHVRVRERHTEAGLRNGMVFSRWKPWTDISVETWLWPEGEWHWRIHRITTPRPLLSQDAGFSVPVEDDEAPADVWNKRTVDAPPFIKARNGFCGLHDPSGTRLAKMTVALPGTNLIWRRTVVPKLELALAPGEHWLTMAVLATTDPAHGETLWATPPDTEAARQRVSKMVER